MGVLIQRLRVEHREDGFGIGVPKPRLSWAFKHDQGGREEKEGEAGAKDWKQSSCDIEIDRAGAANTEKHRIESDQSLHVAWPSAPLQSRERLRVRVTSHGVDGTSATSEWLDVEAGLFDRKDWKAELITGPVQDADKPKPPFALRKTFIVSKGKAARAGTGTGVGTGTARIYATAHGLYKLWLNDQPVGDQVLAPGWQAYRHHLNYQIYDISDLLRDGENTIVGELGEGWFAGRIGFMGSRNQFGDRLGLLCQIEVDGEVVDKSDNTWQVVSSPVLLSEIYNGEVYDTNVQRHGRETIPLESGGGSGGGSGRGSTSAEVIAFPQAQLISPDAPPVKRIMEIKAIEKIITPSGKTILDFGQNLVGWVRIERDFQGTELLLRHAEVLENGELGVRPLRTAKCSDRIILGGSTEGWEPSYTFHGFRYVEITGVECDKSDFTAIVIMSALRQTGTFECSHAMINKLHQNVIWALRGNFVSVPTDCPQRDERLGWTADINVFTPTASFLFDTCGFLSGWLNDLAVDTIRYGGVVPEVVPYVPLFDGVPRPSAIWADTIIITPWDVYTYFDDKQVLERQWESMCLWLHKGLPRQANGLWEPSDVAFGDWLDPNAYAADSSKRPPAFPAHGTTDPMYVSNVYLVYVTRLAMQIAKLLGKDSESKSLEREYLSVKDEFEKEYVSRNGRLVSDTQTAQVLALHFDVLDSKDHIATTVNRLDWLIRWDSFNIATGFAGTPVILDTLADHGKLNLAYRMLQEKDNPSWLYPVSMGATTTWERWDSMLPDGSINPGQMTSFNHYAYGAVANFMHTKIGGLSPLEPGWKKALIKPLPGGTVTSAKVTFDSPYGEYLVDWTLQGEKMKVRAVVPPNTTAQVVLPGVEETIGSGTYNWEVTWAKDAEWPPKRLKGPTRFGMPDEFVP